MLSLHTLKATSNPQQVANLAAVTPSVNSGAFSLVAVCILFLHLTYSTLQINSQRTEVHEHSLPPTR